MVTQGNSITRIVFGYAATCLAVIAGAVVFASPAQAGEVSGNVTLTTDYVWRGSSQTLEKPAAQAGMKFAGQKGFYASAWGSNVEFAPALSASSEFDLTIGWGGKVGDDWAIDVNALRYVYPGTTVNVDWNEVNASATWRDRAWVGVGHSTNAMASGARGTYVNGGVRIPAGEKLRFEIGAGHYAMADALPDYSHAWASGVWVFKAPFELRITAHATDNRAKTRFGNDFAGNRMEAALQASF
ncbi:MAG: TorF family putative porin [Luteimonas sp.]